MSAIDQTQPTLSMLHERVDKVRPEDIEKVNQFLIELEFRRTFAELRDVVGKDWEDGKMERLDEVIAEVRAERRKRSV